METVTVATAHVQHYDQSLSIVTNSYLLNFYKLFEKNNIFEMRIKTVVVFLCLAAISALLLKETGVIQPKWTELKDVLPKDQFVELARKVCGTDESTESEHIDCLIDLHTANKRHGYSSDFFYSRLAHWTRKFF